MDFERFRGILWDSLGFFWGLQEIFKIPRDRNWFSGILDDYWKDLLGILWDSFGLERHFRDFSEFPRICIDSFSLKSIVDGILRDSSGFFGILDGFIKISRHISEILEDLRGFFGMFQDFQGFFGIDCQWNGTHSTGPTCCQHRKSDNMADQYHPEKKCIVIIALNAQAQTFHHFIYSSNRFIQPIIDDWTGISVSFLCHFWVIFNMNISCHFLSPFWVHLVSFLCHFD